MTDKSKNEMQQARLTALTDISARLGASLDPNEVINQIMGAIVQLTGAERAVMMLYDDTSGELQMRASRTEDNRDIDGRSLHISRSVVERAITTGQAILTDNAQEDERFATQQSVVGLQLRSIMCAPLRIRGYTLGAVYVDNRLLSGVFAAEDLSLLKAFVNQAAIALDNARLFTQTDQALARRLEEVSLFQRIDQQLSKSLDLNRVLSLSLEWALNLTNADGGSIGLIEPGQADDTVLRLLVHRGRSQNGATRVIPISHPVLATVLASEEAAMAQDLTAAQALAGAPMAQQLAVPIKREGDIIGLITLESQQPGALSHDDEDFVERLADRAAVAIHNAQLYADLEAASKAKTDFVSLVTHELRLPLTSIKGYTDLIYSGMAGPLSDQQRQFMDVMRRNLNRMSALISDLSDINRIEAGRMRFELEQFDIREVVGEVVETFREALADKEQSLAVDIADEVPLIYADPKRISQVLNNLVSNAHKYTPKNGRIALTINSLPTCIQVAVRDDGIGISAEDQDQLFTQFFRAESQAVRNQTGWGLGLSIVKNMVQAQGGDIRFESALGEGSTFTFTVPVEPATAPAALSEK